MGTENVRVHGAVVPVIRAVNCPMAGALTRVGLKRKSGRITAGAQRIAIHMPLWYIADWTVGTVAKDVCPRSTANTARTVKDFCV